MLEAGDVGEPRNAGGIAWSRLSAKKLMKTSVDLVVLLVFCLSGGYL